MTKIKTLLTIIALTISFNIAANPGKEIYDRYCTVCHAPSMAPMFGSPAAHDTQAWNERKELALEKAIDENNSLKTASKDEKEKNIINVLVQSAINGTDKGMPPKGTCMDCTDDELKVIIQFMSSAE